MDIEFEVCIVQCGAAGLVPVLLIGDTRALRRSLGHRNIGLDLTILTVHGKEVISAHVLALHVPDREKHQFTDTQRIVGLVLEIRDIVGIGMGVDDHLTCPFLDALHEILHAGDRVLRHDQDRSIHQDLLVKKDHLALIVWLQVVDDAGRKNAGRVKRDSLPGEDTTGDVLGSAIVGIFRGALTCCLETRERRTDRGKGLSNTFGTVDTEERLTLRGLISQRRGNFRVRDDFVSKQPYRYIYLVQELLILICRQSTADSGIVADIIQEHLLSLLFCMRKRDRSSRHRTDDTALILQ